MVISQAVQDSRRTGWEQLVPERGLRAAQIAKWGMAGVCAVVALSMTPDLRRLFSGQTTPTSPKQAAVDESFDIKVEPANTQIERGTALLITARFGNKKIPNDVEILPRKKEGTDAPPMPMRKKKSHNDPLFAAHTAEEKQNLKYSIKYEKEQPKWNKAIVFNFPPQNQAAA